MKIIWTRHAEQRQQEWERKISEELSGFCPNALRSTPEMLNFAKYYVFDAKNKAIAVQIPIDDFERLENVIENYGLAQVMDETDDDERLSRDDALTYYRAIIDDLEIGGERGGDDHLRTNQTGRKAGRMTDDRGQRAEGRGQRTDDG